MRAKIVEVIETVQRLELQYREVDYKLSAAQKQIEINTGMIAAGGQRDPNQRDIQGNYAIETQFNFLRDQLNDER
jgi:hypothetical protein